MGDDENKSLADRMKSKGKDSEKALADSKRDTQESASLQKRLSMSGEESDPAEVTRPSRAGFADKFQDALEHAQAEAEAAREDETETLADKMRGKAQHKDDDDEPKSLADRMKDDD